jgi:DNA-binding response OmpR family regulator
MNPRILLVDDDRDLSAMLADFMKHEGFEVYLAADDQSAHQHLSDGVFDLVILDVMLPGRSGFEFVNSRRVSPS